MRATGRAARRRVSPKYPTDGEPLARLSPCESVELRSVSAGRERVRPPVGELDVAVVRDLAQAGPVRVDRPEVSAFAEAGASQSEDDLLAVGRPDGVGAAAGVGVVEAA